MRKLTLLLTLVVSIGWAQNYNNHWQLGVSDINFTTNPPTVGTVSNNGQYGNATISDSNGNLLFYTNGAIVWNKNHAVMTNGSPQVPPYINNVMIVPNPANANQYYIFRAIQYNTLGSTSNCMYTYSIVEFNAANPLGILLNINPFPDGSITTNYSLRLKDAGGNEFTNAFSFSPLTVASNAAGDGYWVIVQSNYKVLSYKLDTAGFNIVPIESTFTNAQIYDPGVNLANPGYGGFDIRGRVESMFKISPDNAKLGGLITTSRQNSPTYTCNFYTLSFNSTTGQFSNFVDVHSENTIMIPKMVEDFEFSANSDNVYFVRFPFNLNNPGSPVGEILVKNLSNLANPVRTLNEFGNTTSPANFNYLQRDKYGNIWISSTFTANSRNQYLHKIDNQNSYSGSSVILNSVSLNTHPISVMPQPIPNLVPACPNTLQITQNVTAGQDNKQAANSIVASNTIGSGASAIYHAADSVLLTPSFVALAGATVHLYNAGCTGTFLARTSQDYLSEESITQRDDPQSQKTTSIRVFPNPNNGLFKLSFNNLAQGLIEVTDFIGNKVFQSEFRETREMEIDLQSKPKGIYIIKVVSGEQAYTQKMVKY